MNVELILGIDGGGSKTRALVADQDGHVLGVGSGPSSNYQSVGFEAATAAVQHALDAALHQAGGVSGASVVAACLGLAGVDRPNDRVLWERWLVQTKLAPRCVLVNDAELVLAAGTPHGWGVALICGTGSICYGRSPDSTTTRAGGWGYLLGDEGSGYDMALQALRLATQTADGRTRAHAVLEAVLQHWNLAEPTQLIGHVYGSSMTRAALAQLARPIMQLADNGDPHARIILDRAATELGRLINVVARTLWLQEPPLALGGGLIGASAVLQQQVCAQAGVVLGPVQQVDDPAHGALRIAQRLLTAPLDRSCSNG